MNLKASRISTYLHQKSKLGNLPKTDAKLCFNPCSAFFGKSKSSVNRNKDFNYFINRQINQFFYLKFYKCCEYCYREL